MNTSRRLNVPCPERPGLQTLLDKAKIWWDQASENERTEMLRAQRRSWVVGEMLLAHPEMTRAEVEKLVDSIDR